MLTYLYLLILINKIVSNYGDGSIIKRIYTRNSLKEIIYRTLDLFNN